MSQVKKEEWPEIGEQVVASVSRITPHGVYLMLDEYEREGFLHISEISSGWVRNIHDFLHEGEKTVLKVLRVDPEKNHIDLSLRRVSRGERRERMLLWKRGKKAESLIRSTSQKLGTPVNEIIAKAWVPLEQAFEEVYGGLEVAAREGAEPLLKLGIPKEIAEVLAEISKEKIKIPRVKVKSNIEISCTSKDGVLKIKDALLKAKEAGGQSGVDINIFVVSPPKYRVEVTATDYKEANAVMRQVLETASDKISRAGGQGVFERGQH